MIKPSFRLVFLMMALPAFAADEPAFERVFGPEVATGPYKHPACMTELSNGDFYLVYYGGKGEYATDTSVFGSRRKNGSAEWSAPVAIAHEPEFSVGNAVVWEAPDDVVWEAPDDVVWLFYVVRPGKTWSTSRVEARRSLDHAETWSEPIRLIDDVGTLVRNRPIVLPDGDYLLPLYHEDGEDTEATGPGSYSFFLRYSVKDGHWTKTPPIRSSKGNIQPAVVALTEKDLLAYCRRGGDYKPETIGYIVKSESHDGGRTWSPGEDTSFPNPNAAVDLLKLASGRLLLVYNNSMSRRTPLSLAVSADAGKSWPIRFDLLTGNQDYGYPIAFQSRDRKIHLVYTSDRRSVVNHAVFDEDWLLRDRP
jgi:predicted neuraminidase